jgi:hypothetical protein
MNQIDSVTQRLKQASELIQEGVVSDVHAAVAEGLDIMAECFIEAIGLKRFDLIERMNATQRDLFSSLEIIVLAKRKKLNAKTFALLLEHFSPATHLVWGAGAVNATLSVLLAENYAKFRGDVFSDGEALGRHFCEPQNTKAFAIVLDRQLQRVATHPNDARASHPLSALEMYQKMAIDHAKPPFPQILIDVVLKHREEILTTFKKLGSQPFSIGRETIKALHDHGFTELMPLMLEQMIIKSDDAGCLISMEAEGYVITDEFRHRSLFVLTNAKKNAALLAHAIWSEKITPEAFSDLLPKKKQSDYELKGLGRAINAVFSMEMAPKQQAILSKTKTFLAWLEKQPEGLSPHKQDILTAKYLPDELILSFKTLVEDKLATDLGL